LDNLIWQDLVEMVKQPELIAMALQRAQGGEWLPQELQSRRDNLRRSVKGLTHQIERLTEAYLAEVIGLEEYKRRRVEIESRQQSLEEQVRSLESQAHQQLELAGLITSIEDLCKRVQSGLSQATFEQKRQLVELLIDRVIINGEEVEIRYVIPTSDKSEHIRFCNLRKDYTDRLPYRTLSGGIATFPEYGEVTSLCNMADQALYKAKRAGRNQIQPG
jgi:site-specific DNA recombinase